MKLINKLFKIARRINPKFKRDATALHIFLQKQTDYISKEDIPFNHSWEYWSELLRYLNDGFGIFIDEHFKNGILLVANNGKIRSLDIADKTRTSLLDQLDIMRIMLETDADLLEKYSATKLKKDIERAFQRDKTEFVSKFEIWKGFNDLITRGDIA